MYSRAFKVSSHTKNFFLRELGSKNTSWTGQKGNSIGMQAFSLGVGVTVFCWWYIFRVIANTVTLQLQIVKYWWKQAFKNIHFWNSKSSANMLVRLSVHLSNSDSLGAYYIVAPYYVTEHKYKQLVSGRGWGDTNRLQNKLINSIMEIYTEWWEQITWVP